MSTITFNTIFMSNQILPEQTLQRIRSMDKGRIYVVGDSHACRQIADVLGADPRLFYPMSGPKDLEGTHQPIVLIAPNWRLSGSWAGMEDMLEKTQAQVHKISYFRAQVFKAMENERDSRRMYSRLPAMQLTESISSDDSLHRFIKNFSPVYRGHQKAEAVLWDGSLDVIKLLQARGVMFTVDQVPKDPDTGAYLGLKIYSEAGQCWNPAHIGYLLVYDSRRECIPTSFDVFISHYRPPSLT
jgi:hypothetical protein